MGCSVKTLLATFDSDELTEWQAFFRLEPFGAWADNLNFGRIITTVRGIFKKKGSPQEDAKDLALGDYKEPLWVTAQSQDEQLMTIEDIAKAFGAQRKKRDKDK